MKKKFEEAVIEIMEFEAGDVITASGGRILEENELPGVNPLA